MQFTQKTEFYKGDSLVKKATWYEILVYPDVLRIDFEDTISGNFALWRNDSLYRSRKGQLVQAIKDTNALLHVFGGWRVRSQDSNKARWIQAGIDIEKCCYSRYRQRKVLVIGANSPLEKVPQIWIDAQRGYTHRVLLRANGNQWQEIICSKQEKIAGKWVETQVDFYLNKELIQREYYQNIKVDSPYDASKINVPSTYHR